MIKLALANKAVPKDEKSKTILSKEYGASYALLRLIHDIGLDKMIYSRTSEQWVKDVQAMIIGRIVYAGSKLKLSNLHKSTALWELCGVLGKVDVDEHCYQPMDRLLERQKAIQKQLVKKHLVNGTLIMYDITSSYMEGEYVNSEIVADGYNRDLKKGHEQICIGLICNEEGCPVIVEVFPGNTQDAQTVIGKINELKKEYSINDILFVGDRGMVTPLNYEEISSKKSALVLTALTHRQIKELLARKVIQLGLFDENNIVEVIDPEAKEKRYCLCRNPNIAIKERKTRREILSKIGKKLDKISAVKKKRKAELIGKQVGKVFGKTNMEHFIDWKVKNGRMQWNFNEEKITEAEAIDGCYIIFTDIPEENLNKNEVVKSYKNLILVEQAFRLLKTVLIEMRPMYHHKDDRIRCHVFICMLSYYVLWHFKNKLKQLFEDKNNKGKNRYWTIENVIERLKCIRKDEKDINGIKYYEITMPDEDQKKILEYLDITM